LYAIELGPHAVERYAAQGGKFYDEPYPDWGHYMGAAAGMTPGMYAAKCGADSIKAFAAAGGTFTDPAVRGSGWETHAAARSDHGFATRNLSKFGSRAAAFYLKCNYGAGTEGVLSTGSPPYGAGAGTGVATGAGPIAQQGVGEGVGNGAGAGIGCGPTGAGPIAQQGVGK
jgi:hypothetical protein